MDLQKEREAFETLQNQKIFKWFEFDSNLNAYALKDISASFEKLTALAELNYGWDMWQAAKAKAIPDGYVLMPKEPNREFKDRLRSYLDNLWMGDHGCDWDYFVDATAIKPNEIWRFMIEAQEPANESE